MSVTIKYNIEPDNLSFKNENYRDRLLIPYILKIRFFDDETGKLLMQYVPKLSDEEIFKSAFDLLRDFNNLKETQKYLYKINQGA